MYAVVGCRDCRALWIVDGRPETTRCPRCGARRKHDSRRTFIETDDEDRAREMRASMLATRQGHGTDFADLDSFAEMETRVDDAGLSDEQFLAASGLDVAAIDDASDRADGSNGTVSSSGNRKETVLAALRDLDDPTADDVEAYAVERGVPADYVEEALSKLVRSGDVSEHRGRYRLL